MYNKIAVLGIKMDLGKLNRGADQAPEVLRKQGLLNNIKCNVKDFGDLSIEISDKLNLDNTVEFKINDIITDFEDVSKFVSSVIT